MGKVGIAECSGTCSLSPVGACFQGSNDLVAMDRPLSGGCNVKCGIDNVPDTVTVTHEAAVGLSNRIGIVVARIYQKRNINTALGRRGGKEQGNVRYSS